MKVIFFSHPDFMDSKSMPLFLSFITRNFEQFEIWKPQPIFTKYFGRFNKLKKWVGYVDQYVIFPIWVFLKLRKNDNKVFFIFSDQAQGPWVPLVCRRPHIIHCHDLMALRSALGEIPENKTKYSGKIYQKFIRWGFSFGKNFISISNKTRLDLERIGMVSPDISVVIPNALNGPFRRVEEEKRKGAIFDIDPSLWEKGYILHVGGDQWYKNRSGVLDIYSQYVSLVDDPLPLLMIGPVDNCDILERVQAIKAIGGIVFMANNVNFDTLCAVYSHAKILIFPSFDEGFGWPIIEAQACGCPVITTDCEPMTEVGGRAAFYIPRKNSNDSIEWAMRGAYLIKEILDLPSQDKEDVLNRGYLNVKRFDGDFVLSEYMKIYRKVLGRSSEL